MKKLFICVFVALSALSCSDDDTTVTMPTDPAEIVLLPCASKESITLITQADVDAFKEKGYCSVWKLRIGPEEGVSNITDLTPLEGLLNIEESLEIENNPHLQTLKGLQNVVNVGANLIVSNNNILTGLEGLEGVKTIGSSLVFFRNNNLVSLAALKDAKVDANSNIQIAINPKLEVLGLENVTQLSELRISDNNALKNLNGLLGLKSVNLLLVEENDAFESLSGLEVLEFASVLKLEYNPLLESIEEIRGATVKTLSIKSTDVLNSLTPLLEVNGLVNIILYGNRELTSLEGLNNFTAMNNISIAGNPKLTSLSALSGVTSITNMNTNGSENGIGIEGNSMLQTLDGLQNVANFEGFINISGNNKLTDFCAIQNIIDNGNYSGYYFNIADNKYSPDFTQPGGCSLD